MTAISVGSVEVDVLPSTKGIYARLRDGLVPAATKAGEDAGRAAGRSFGPAMQSEVGNLGLTIGQQIGQEIAARIVAEIRDAIKDGITQGGKAALPSAARQGDETAGAFSRALKARLEAAFRSLPKLQIGANTSEADSDLQALRVRLETLSGRRIGIDISDTEARAEIAYLEGELRRLGTQHPNIQVRADTASALAHLAAVRAAMDAVDERKSFRFDVDTSAATSAIFRLSVAIAAVGLIPTLPILTAGLGALASAAIVAATGIGALAAVAVPGILGIGKALQAQKAAQDAATSATNSGGQAASQAASRALQMAGAQQALAQAHRQAAQQIAAARDAVVQAERGVQTAERDLVAAQREARQAQQDLTAARREAAQQLEDLNNRLVDSQLSQRDAQIALQEAAAQRNKVLADPKATTLDRQKAILAYDQAVQRLKEQTTETKRLSTQTAAANRAGVNGSKTVKDAADRLASAQQNVRDKTLAVADAHRQVAKAEAGVAVAQQNAADAIASAQRQVASASMQSASGMSQAATAQAKYRAALAKLTPAARATFDAFIRLRTAFSAWSRSLQPAVMPIFTRALDGIRRSLPGLTPIVLAAAGAVKELQDRFSAGLKSGWFQSFKKSLIGGTRPAIVGLGVAFGNVFKFIGGVVDAFLPHMQGVAREMDRITGRWANWATGLKGSDKFEGFLAYVKREGPVVAGAIGDISSAFYQTSKALSPLSGPVLQVLGAVARAVASIATTLPWLIQGLYLAYIATKIWTLAQILFNAVMDANPITLIILGIIALVAAVIYAYKRWGWFREAVQATWDAIKTASLWVWHNVLQPLFSWVAKIVVWLWNTILKPYIGFLIAYWKEVGRIAMWLWRNILAPVVHGIVLLFKIWWTAVKIYIGFIGLIIWGLIDLALWLWHNVISPVVHGIVILFRWWWQGVKLYIALVELSIRAVAAVFRWLWRKIVTPVLHAIVTVAKWWWAGVKLYFGQVRNYILKPLASAFTWLWRKVVSPALHGIRSVISTVWRTGIRPIFNTLKSAVGKVADAFDTARGDIKKAWNKIEGIAKKPVAFVINTVYNRGIVGVWNKIAKFVGLDKLHEFHPKGFAEGGFTGPGGKTTPAGVVHAGEFVTRAESTARIQRQHPGALDYMNRTGMLPGYKGGGIVGDIVDTAKKVGGAVMSGLDFITNPGKLWDKAVGSIKDKIKGIGDSPWARAVGHVPTKILKALKDKVVKAATSVFGGGGGALPSGPHSRSAAKAMAYAQSLLRGGIYGWGMGQWPSLRALWMGESGWNPYAVNRSSGAAGIPQALGHGHVFDLGDYVRQIAWGLRYIHSRYGNPSRAWATWLHRSPHWYDQGGWLQPGWNFNGLKTPEAVLTPRQLTALEGAAAAGVPRGADGPSTLTGDLYLDSGEFLGQVRGVVQAENQQLTAVLRAGRR